jgi:regulator of protease activity HflC (stomatin/prohibitin superfamily)
MKISKINLNSKLNLKKILIIVALLIFVLPVLARANPLYTVEYGTMGVVSRFGKVSRQASPGLNFKVPFVEKVHFYTTQKIIYETSAQPTESRFYNQTKSGNTFSSSAQKDVSDSTDFPVDTSTEDGQQVSIRFTLRYQLDPNKVT